MFCVLVPIIGVCDIPHRHLCLSTLSPNLAELVWKIVESPEWEAWLAEVGNWGSATEGSSLACLQSQLDTENGCVC